MKVLHHIQVGTVSKYLVFVKVKDFKIGYLTGYCTVTEFLLDYPMVR